MPSKEKRAADLSATRDTDVIGLSPRKKIAKQGKQRDDIPDAGFPHRIKADMDRSVLQDKKSTRKNLPVAENLPDNQSSATSQPTSPASVSRQKKKPATFEVSQEEAGPVRAAEKKKAKPKAVRQEQETNADAREIGEGGKPGRVGKKKKAAKEEGMEKKPGKTTKGTKDD
jgi:hypothetical protein